MNMHACRMRELTADGKADPAELLKDAGFHVGSFVRRKQDRAEAKIVSIERVLVNLQIQPDGTQGTSSLQSFLDGEWVVFVPREAPAVIENLLPHKPSQHPEWKVMAMITSVQAELLQITESQEACYEHLSVQVKPSKMVLANTKIAKNKLSLAPSTTKVVPKRVGQVVSGGYEVKTPSDDMCFWLLPTLHWPKDDTDSGFLSAFWLVSAVTEESEANMAIHYVKGSWDHKVEIPIMKNTKPLNAGDCLKVYKPKPVRALEKLVISPSKKIRKTK